MRLAEKDIVRTIVDWLQLDGWRPIKMEPISRREWGKGTGETGQPDYLFVRYWNQQRKPEPHDMIYNVAHLASGNSVFWCEFKNQKGRYSKAQIAWTAQERARGGVVLQVGMDCPGTIEGIQDWYRGSGLMRRKI
jgi:hypothetical protein